jgi:hypothetical protein
MTVPSWTFRAGGLWLFAALLFASGCAEPVVRVNYLEEGAALQTLGWLGGKSHPLTKVLEITHEQEVQAPGGLVLTEVVASGVLAQAGAQRGDVVVRVGEEWVPLREDPTLDVLEQVEQLVSAGSKEVAFGCWRDGTLVELTLPLDQPALEVGLPLEVQRFQQGAQQAIAKLQGQQRKDGGWDAGSPATELAIDSLAGLAMQTQGPQNSAASAKAKDRVKALAGDETGVQDPVSLSLATMFLAEHSGALPEEMLIEASREKTMENLPEGLRDMFEGSPMTGGNPMTITLDNPEDLSGLLESLGGATGGHVQVFSVGAGEGPPPEFLDQLPEGAEIMELPEGASFQMGELPEGMTFEAGELPEGMRLDGSASFEPPEPPDVAELLAEKDPGRVSPLRDLQAVVDHLLQRQQDEGSWPASSELAADSLQSTTLALTALGLAQRAGARFPAQAIEKGCQFLRDELQEGKLAAAVAKGADRRQEAGRAACGALALQALGCADRDEFFEALVDYSEDRGAAVRESPAGRAWHLFSLAVLRRNRGVSDWQRFYDEFRIPLVAWQNPDGSFSIPCSSEASAAEQSLSGETFDTALGALLLSLQSEHAPVLIGRAENPFALPIDGEGKTPLARLQEKQATSEPELEVSEVE